MRLNVYLAQRSSLSRRSADAAIAAGRVYINDRVATLGQTVSEQDIVKLDGTTLETVAEPSQTILLHKPPGYVCSRNGQGSKTIYELLPDSLHRLNPVGRLDKNSSGLLLMTNDGKLAQELTHPSKQKIKIYHVTVDKPLQPLHQQMISDFGINLDDGISRLILSRLDDSRTCWEVRMHEGRNRQIRRTFAALGYEVSHLHRITFGNYSIDTLRPGEFSLVQ